MYKSKDCITIPMSQLKTEHLSGHVKVKLTRPKNEIASLKLKQKIMNEVDAEYWKYMEKDPIVIWICQCVYELSDIHISVDNFIEYEFSLYPEEDVEKYKSDERVKNKFIKAITLLNNWIKECNK